MVGAFDIITDINGMNGMRSIFCAGFAAVLVLAAATMTASSAATVTIVKGKQITTATTTSARAAGGLPYVLRGHVPKAAAVSHVMPAEADWTTRGGSRLWLINRRDGRVVACDVVAGVMADTHAISCTNRLADD